MGTWTKYAATPMATNVGGYWVYYPLPGFHDWHKLFILMNLMPIKKGATWSFSLEPFEDETETTPNIKVSGTWK